MKTFKKLLTLILVLSAITLNAQNSSFEVQVIGKGKPVLLFPGFTCTGEVWNLIVEEISKTHQCHVFTFAGFGEIPAIEKPWLPKIKESVVQYISDQQLEKPTLIGHSLGGTLALWMASENDAYEQLIVVDALPSTGALMMPNFNSEYMVYDNPYNTQLLGMDDKSFEQMAAQMAQGMTLNTSKRALLKNWIVQADRATYVYGYTDLLKLDLRDAVKHIKTPVTILGATEPYGLETVKKTFHEQYVHLKDYTIKFADASAHFIMFDQPEWLLNEIKLVLE
tara:strand:+ start:188445 stop:189284 length:840 start_codon:yes stop_codon:yes gene_type:complete